MPLVHFDSGARFEHDDLLLITRTLGQLLEASSGWPPRAIGPITAARVWLGASVGLTIHEPAHGRRASTLSGKAAAPRGELGRNTLIDLEKERVLDLAADLLDVSRLLSAADLPIEAFALEGIEGRLLEAIVGAGPVEVVC
ncbi:MAG: hypothetical protein ABSD78_12890 [Acidimicrobiales bacterium]